MSDKEEKNTATENVPAAENMFRFMGKDYDLGNPQERARLEGARDTFESMFGKQAQAVGELRQQAEQSRKYQLDAPTPDDATIMQKVKELRAEGREEDAFNLMFEYNNQTRESLRAEIGAEREFEALWADYKAARPDIFGTFAPIDERVYKNYVKTEYGKTLGEVDNQFELLDRVLGPKATQQLPKDTAATRPAAEVVETGIIDQGTAAPFVPKASDAQEPDVQQVFSEHLADMGFKKMP